MKKQIFSTDTFIGFFSSRFVLFIKICPMKGYNLLLINVKHTPKQKRELPRVNWIQFLCNTGLAVQTTWKKLNQFSDQIRKKKKKKSKKFAACTYHWQSLGEYKKGQPRFLQSLYILRVCFSPFCSTRRVTDGHPTSKTFQPIILSSMRTTTV